MKRIIFMLLFVLLASSAYAQKEGHLHLLAVSETDQGMVGSLADLYLQIIPGEGRVFLDTFPLTKLDTQMSTRFAKEIACNYYEINCDRYDFIYTIRAKSPIVGGPSAGTAITVLTASLLLGEDVNESVAITGTINSGGIVGTVSGIKQKIEAAKTVNITKVIIPKGTRFHKENESLNETLDLLEYGKEHGIEVIEASFFSEAMHHISGLEPEDNEEDIAVTKEYNETMKKVAFTLCNRSKMLFNKIYSTNDSEYPIGVNMSNMGIKEYNEGNFYSSASYCFGANVRFNYLVLNQTNAHVGIEKIKLILDIENFTQEFNSQKLETITDLQTSIIVNERLAEAQDVASKLNRTNDHSNFAYAVERYYSAISWSKFFGTGTKKIIINQETLKSSCEQKLKEADERYQYANLIYPTNFDSAKDLLSDAIEEMGRKRYDLCLFKASKSKAQSDMFLSLLGATEEDLEDVLDIKLEAIEKIIVDQNKKGNFPILGYSYYQYSRSLSNHEPSSAILYSEYALELSDLDVYFEQEKKVFFKIEFTKEVVFFLGLAIGILVGFLLKKDYINIKNK